ncbi:MAG: type II toxin-antitoxin system VapC family toxin [Candidatus Asgardarchaeia archaeon]
MGIERVGVSKAWALGIVDVGPIVLSHCENPAKNEAIDFIERVILGEINAVIPLTTFIGAYHIMTRYLRINREKAANELLATLELRSPVFLGDLSIDETISAIRNAFNFNIDGWDGYLVTLAEKIGASIIYTIDKKLAKVKHLSIVTPISEHTLKIYHDWLSAHTK